MIGKIKTVVKSKSGKAFRVQFEGNDAWFGAFLDSKIDQAVGKVVDATITPDKGFGPGIGAWAYSQEIVQPSPANSPAGASGGAYADRWWLPFVSNQVAHAIAAGKIQTPNDMNTWAKAAKECIQATDIL